MNRFKTATAAFLVASFIGLQPVAALADGNQRRYGYDDQLSLIHISEPTRPY